MPATTIHHGGWLGGTKTTIRLGSKINGSVVCFSLCFACCACFEIGGEEENGRDGEDRSGIESTRLTHSSDNLL